MFICIPFVEHCKKHNNVIYHRFVDIFVFIDFQYLCLIISNAWEFALSKVCDNNIWICDFNLLVKIDGLNIVVQRWFIYSENKTLRPW